MKKRIVSMILALSMMLSILPVSAFADAGAGLSSAAAEETNSITYSSENEYEDVGTNSETKNQVVKIKTGTNGLPKAASGTGWSFDETTGLTITGVENTNIEYILDGPVSCDVTICNAAGVTVYLLNGVVTRKLRINADNMYGVYVLGGSYADVELNLGTIDGGTYDKLTENGGNVRGGFFRDISGLSARTQQQAHQLLLPENCTLNGRNETGDIYIIKPYNFSGKGNDLELVVESDTGCDAWAVVSTGGSAMALPAGTQNYPFTYFGSTIATVSISHDGKTLSASFNMIPAQDDAPMKLVPVVLGTTTELHFNSKGQPDLNGVTGVPVSGEGMTANLYEGLGWKYATKKENGRTRAALYITTPDGNPVNLASGAINPYHKAIAVEQITFANVTVTGIVAEGSVGAENTIIQDGTFQKDVYADDNSTIAGGTFQDVVRAYGTITGGAFNAVVQLNQNSEVTGGVFHDIQLPSYATEKTVIQNAMILGSLKTDGDSKAAVSNTVSCGYIESKYLAAGQQQSKLMMTDGTVERLNDYAAATDAVYLIGNVKAEIRFSNTVTNINGAEASNYNEGTSAIDRSLTITAKNDGEPIVVNMAATGKLPFSSLSKSDFDIDWSTLVPGITCKKDGVGKLSLVYVRTSDNKVFATYPPYDEYGVYKQRIVAQEGDKYTEGSLDIGEVVRKYTPSRADFAYDSKTQTATYNGKMYFDDAPLYSIQYVSEDGSFPSVTKPTKAGTYSVYIVVNDSDHYVGNQYEVGTYVVPEPTKPKYYYYWNAQEGKAHNEGDKITLSVDKQEGNNVIWKIEGLAEDAYTITDTGTHIELQFSMPSNDVRVTNRYEPIYYTLTVDGKEERRAFGKEVTFTAPEKGGHTFTGWEVDGVPEGTDTSKATITFTMPANNVTLTPQYKKNTYTLTVDGKDEPRVFDEDVTVIAQPVEGKTFTGWKVTGLPTDVDTSKATITFKMPANKVTLKAEYTENAPETYELKVTDAQVTLKDGGDVADLTAVPVGTELVATAPEKEGYTFDSWEKEGLPADANIDGATVTFKMPANKVTLNAKYIANAPETYKLDVTDAKVTLKDGGTVADLTAVPVGTELVATADEKDGYTFTGWEVAGLPADVDTTKATISFKMPANKVTLKAQYTENAPETYELKVTNAKVTLKDGGTVADLTAVPVGTELVATADEDTETSKFKSWSCTGLELTEEQSTARVLEFTMPDRDVDLMAAFDTLTKPDPDPTPAPGGDSDGGGAAIVAVAAVGGAAIGAGAYIVGTTAYLKSVLPEGMAIPANRQQLAVALWTAAGKPATQSTALFNDVAADAAELQAIRWVVETGLMSAQDGNFKPGSRVGRLEVIRTWKTYQQRG